MLPDMKKILTISFIITFSLGFADTAAQRGQSLLSAQYNYQSAQDKYDSSKKEYSDAQDAYAKAKKQLADAKSEVEQRHKDLIKAKSNLEKSTKVILNAKNNLNNAWDKANASEQNSGN